MKVPIYIALFCLMAGAAIGVCGASPVLSLDCREVTGNIRPLHGLNKGPRVPGGLIDLTREHLALNVPHIRLHDCGWPNPMVVDIHAVFPDPTADPALPESYDFRLTDEYVSAVRATGAQVIYRLGESIEHTTVKRFVHPPAGPEHWAKICLGIIRHYNDGWARGFRHGIQYWEIWNEPENRPAMWSGTDEDYFRLYRVAARAIKQVYPGLKVGGPAVGASGQFHAGRFIPTGFVTNFLAMCRRDSVPLDFFSWHCYTDRSEELSARAHAIRELLNTQGFLGTESHLNEWNFLPGNSWAPLSRSSSAGARQVYYDQMAGAPGAAFVLAALLELQDAPLDVANLFHGELGGFGIFNEHGVIQPVYHALRWFGSLPPAEQRIKISGTVSGQLAALAVRAPDASEITLLLSHSDPAISTIQVQLTNLPWGAETDLEIETRADGMVRSERRSLPGTGGATLDVALKAPGMARLRLVPRPAAPTYSGGATLKLSAPAERLVYQRGLNGRGRMPVAGSGATPGCTMLARLTRRPRDTAAGKWTPCGIARIDGTFSGYIDAPTGWFRLEVRTQPTNTATPPDPVAVERVGMGEVFIIVGHSVAQGGELNLPGADDDRVNTIALGPVGGAQQTAYEQTGAAGYLPPAGGTAFATGVRPAPFGHGPYFWAQLGERIARRDDVPVLLLNAAFGGTSLEHWAKSSRGVSFEHSFVKSAIGMPYQNLRHALQKYARITGVRAILADQGQNDWPQSDPGIVFGNYRTWVEQARTDLDFPNLAVVVNRQTPPGHRTAIRLAQERMIREHPHCWAGPDYDSLLPADRPDGIHLSESGARKAADLWADALPSQFFQTVKPYLAR